MIEILGLGFCALSLLLMLFIQELKIQKLQKEIKDHLHKIFTLDIFCGELNDKIKSVNDNIIMLEGLVDYDSTLVKKLLDKQVKNINSKGGKNKCK